MQVGPENLKLIPIMSTGGDIMQGGVSQADMASAFLTTPCYISLISVIVKKDSKLIVPKSQKYGSQKNPQKSVISPLPFLSECDMIFTP